MSEQIVAVYQLDAAVARAMEEFNKEHSQELGAIVKRTANRCRNTLKATSPRGRESKHYADGWRVAFRFGTFGAEAVVYNSSKPGLAHLLNDGHVAANKYGTYGFVGGDRHIDKAAQEAVDYLIEQLGKAGAL